MSRLARLTVECSAAKEFDLNCGRALRDVTALSADLRGLAQARGRNLRNEWSDAGHAVEAERRFGTMRRCARCDSPGTAIADVRLRLCRNRTETGLQSQQRADVSNAFV
jgi:hypothetical protein